MWFTREFSLHHRFVSQKSIFDELHIRLFFKDTNLCCFLVPSGVAIFLFKFSNIKGLAKFCVFQQYFYFIHFKSIWFLFDSENSLNQILKIFEFIFYLNRFNRSVKINGKFVLWKIPVSSVL